MCATREWLMPKEYRCVTAAAVSEPVRQPPATSDLSSDACFIDLRKSKRKKNEEQEVGDSNKKEKKEERRYLPEDETKQLVTSYVFSRLDYCNSLLSPLFNSCRKFKILLRALFSEQAPRHQNCTSLLQQLHWLPISVRIKCNTTCM